METKNKRLKDKNKRLNNRKRCLSCEYYERNACSLMADSDVFEIDNCILDNKEYNLLKETSIGSFLLEQNPDLLLKYLNYQNMNDLPTVGDKVLTLRNGYGGYKGTIRYVFKIDEDEKQKIRYIHLTDKKGMDMLKEYNPEEDNIEEYYGNLGFVHSLCHINKWYNDIFVIG